MLPLGLRQNNPGNLRPSNPPWQGETGAANGFAVFDTMANGLRAMGKQIIAYHDAHGIDTVAGTIARWAPSNENNTAAYTSFVCSVLSCNPDDVFDFHDPDFLFWIITAIGEEEQGHDAFTQNVSDAQITQAVQDALA